MPVNVFASLSPKAMMVRDCDQCHRMIERVDSKPRCVGKFPVDCHLFIPLWTLWIAEEESFDNKRSICKWLNRWGQRGRPVT